LALVFRYETLLVLVVRLEVVVLQLFWGLLVLPQGPWPLLQGREQMPLKQVLLMPPLLLMYRP